MSDDLRKPGRPRVPEPSTTVTTWVKSADYDRLVVVARRRDESVSAVIRNLIAAGLHRHKPT
jgi:hypothetical protein